MTDANILITQQSRSAGDSWRPAVAARCPCRVRWLGSFGAAAVLLAGLVALPPRGLAQTVAPGSPAARSADARPPAASIDTRLRRIEESIGGLDERLRRAEDPPAGIAAASTERLTLALLHLETVVGTGRPWLREWQLILALDGAAVVPPVYLEVLGSHASRGLPSARELTERFEALAPAIAARAASDRELLDRGMALVRSTMAGIGLASPAEPGIVETALASIRDHLRRDELAAALAEVATLGEEQQVLLSGWLAQLRARVAVEQSLQEAILALLSGRGRQG